MKFPLEQSKEKKVYPEEEILKKSEITSRRKDQNEKKEAKIKEITIQKLLKRQASKNTRTNLENEQENNAKNKISNKIRYRITIKGNTLSYPEHMINYYENFKIKFGISDGNTLVTSSPFSSHNPAIVKPREKCCIIGCPNFKKYNHSVMEQPVCSVACYKKIKI
ncbi:hypothetical protein H8356DRAFT_923858 [Neocallimastix lanati (nom. inval.)]|uniref:INO80 complex subunit B-like conserved region domain-containing protein n=1 Tax=Neocallimastix californiae TaxID=1754190 RepID=A0A1Y2ES58_9FUNG|nr:hypothetical protein H8356DRAFT_923858 [Neocallimastix sp. JGI-2020a]ORY74421.1 hypothetical protein LY90DRAFT_666222 [Neocallimastix californiae]|eukprot:ORY74421.1 hypothetical protein LY90DRAFT_666222 [Neocallimastix californiae]